MDDAGWDSTEWDLWSAGAADPWTDHQVRNFNVADIERVTAMNNGKSAADGVARRRLASRLQALREVGGSRI